MATQNKYFTDLAIGTEFTLDGKVYRKQSARKAIDASLRDQSRYNGFNVRAHEMVQITVPDPTPEELAAQAEEFRVQQLRRLHWKLDEMISRAQTAQDDLAKALAKGQDGWFGVFTNSSAIESQMKDAAQLHVAVMAKRILGHETEGGKDALQREALRRSMRYARYGHHSTSAVSNIAEEMQAAAWAEVAEACGWDRL